MEGNISWQQMNWQQQAGFPTLPDTFAGGDFDCFTDLKLHLPEKKKPNPSGFVIPLAFVASG